MGPARDTRSTPPVTRSCSVFGDASAVWTLDEVARRFGMTIGEAIRVMSDLEAIDVVRRIGRRVRARVRSRDRLLGGRCDRERLRLLLDRFAIEEDVEPGAGSASRPWSAPRSAPATAAFVSVSPPSATTWRSPSSKPDPSAATWSPIPAVKSANPMSGPSMRRARPASATRYSSSSPPSRSRTAATASSTADRGVEPRTSAAAASVTARQAVRQRSSQCVIAESAGASSRRSSGCVARNAPSGAQYITDPLPAETSGPRSATYRSGASRSPSRARRSTHRVRFPTSGGSVASHPR